MAFFGGELVGVMRIHSLDFNRGMGLAEGKFYEAGKRIAATGRQLTKQVTLPLATIGIFAVKMAADFQSSMSKVQGLVGHSSRQVDAWSKQILEMSKDLPQAPKELGDAFYFVTSAGFAGAEAIEVLRISARAAASGLGETKDVADAITSAVNAYGIENLSAAQAADILTAAVRSGKAEAHEIGAVLGRVLPLASEMGVGFDQVAAAVAAFTKVGLNASEAGTSVQAMLTNIVKENEKGAKVLDGVNSSYAKLRQEIREKGLYQALIDLRDSLGGNVDKMAAVIPTVRGLRGFLGLTGKQAEDVGKIFETTANASGEMDRAFDAAAETTEFKLKQAFSTLQVAMIKLGDIVSPAVVTVVSGVVRMIDSFAELPDSLRVGIGLAVLYLAALGPVLWLTGKAFIAASVVINLFTKDLAKLSIAAKVGLIVQLALVIGVLVLWFRHAYRSSERFREAVDGALRQVAEVGKWALERVLIPALELMAKVGKWAMESVLVPAFEFLKRVLEAVGPIVKDFAERVFENVLIPAFAAAQQSVVDISGVIHGHIIPAFWDMYSIVEKYVVPAFEWIWGVIKDSVIPAFLDMWNALGPILEWIGQRALSLLRVLMPVFAKIVEIVGGALIGIFQGVMRFLGGALKVIGGMITVFASLLTGNWSRLWEGVEAIFSGTWDMIVGALKVFLNFGILRVFRLGLSVLRSMWTSLWNGINTVGRSTWGAITSFFRSAWRVFTAPFQAMGRLVSRIWSALWTGLRTLATRLWDRIMSWFLRAVDFFIRLFRRPVSTLSTIWSRFWTGLRTIAAAVWNAITRFFVAAWNRFSSTFSRLANLINRIWTRFWAGVRTIASSVWNTIRNFFVGAFNQFRDRFATVTNFVRGLWSRFWTGLRTTGTTIWNNIRDRIRTILNSVRTAFERVTTGIRRIWDRLKSIAARPVNFVIEWVWNKGIRRTWNAIAKFIPGVSELSRISPIKFERGGVFDKATAIVGEGRNSHPEYVIPTDPAHRSRAMDLYQSLGARLMERGGILAPSSREQESLSSSIGSIARNVWKMITNPVKTLRGFFQRPLDLVHHIRGSKFGNMIADIPKHLIGKAIDWIKGLAGKIFGGDGEARGSAVPRGTPRGVQQWRPVALQALGIAGQPTSWIDSLMRRMNQESGGNPTVVNKWDINWQRGHPSVGLMQVIGPTYRAYKHPAFDTGPYSWGTSVNPLANILAAIRYTVATYGSGPAGWDRAGGYEKGTLRVPRTGPALIHEGEMILPERIAQAVRDQLSQGGGGGVNVYVNAPQNMTPRQVGDAVGQRVSAALRGRGSIVAGV